MPMSGSNYVAPTWVDNAPPALDAAELQAMCDTIQENQSDAAALQAALQALTTTVSGKAQMQIGTYVGTGTYGSANPMSISYTGTPKFVAITQSFGTYGGYFWAYGAEVGNTNANIVCSLNWNANSLSWYNSDSERYQLNRNGIQYTYVIGY